MVMFCKNIPVKQCYTFVFTSVFVAHFEAPVARWCDNATVGHL